jgi:hypothetical protein
MMGRHNVDMDVRGDFVIMGGSGNDVFTAKPLPGELERVTEEGLGLHLALAKGISGSGDDHFHQFDRLGIPLVHLLKSSIQTGDDLLCRTANLPIEVGAIRVGVVGLVVTHTMPKVPFDLFSAAQLLNPADHFSSHI